MYAYFHFISFLCLQNVSVNKEECRRIAKEAQDTANMLASILQQCGELNPKGIEVADEIRVLIEDCGMYLVSFNAI